MNKAALTAFCHKIANQTGLTFNSVMTYYFLEMILKKLSLSPYAKHYIFKGGFLLSNIIGIQSRSTVDIDFLFHQQALTKERVQLQLTEILTEKPNDIHYTIQSISAIKEHDNYKGYRVSILCQLDNIKQTIHLDIATGDIITPGPITYTYTMVFNNEQLSIMAYTIETILAEKIQTIYARNFLNSRSKDLYDIFILARLKKDEINYSYLKTACQRTFAYRTTELDYHKIIRMLEEFKSSKMQLRQWKNYSIKYSYTKDIAFVDILNEVINLLSKLISY